MFYFPFSVKICPLQRGGDKAVVSEIPWGAVLTGARRRGPAGTKRQNFFGQFPNIMEKWGFVFFFVTDQENLDVY